MVPDVLKDTKKSVKREVKTFQTTEDELKRFLYFPCAFSELSCRAIWETGCLFRFYQVDKHSNAENIEIGFFR